MPNFQINFKDITSGFEYDKKELKKIAKMILSDAKIQSVVLNIVFVDDEFIIKMNKEYLKVDSATDVISFVLENDQEKGALEGEVYADLEQIQRQARQYKTGWINELFRVVIHGILHVVGYDDQSPPEQMAMTEKENHYLLLAKL